MSSSGALASDTPKLGVVGVTEKSLNGATGVVGSALVSWAVGSAGATVVPKPASGSFELVSSMSFAGAVGAALSVAASGSSVVSSKLSPDAEARLLSALV